MPVWPTGGHGEMAHGFIWLDRARMERKAIRTRETMAQTASADSRPRRSYRLGPIGLAATGSLALLLASPPRAIAQVAPGGLGTRVNGTALGRCSAGVCTVEGGTAAGRTLFHRFSQYDTRSGIRRVDLDTRGRPHVVVGVGHPEGSFFGAPLKLSRNANLFWLSPGGLWFGAGGQIQGATSLLLSTAPTLRIGGGEFRAAGGLGEGLGNLGNGSALALDLEALAEGRLDGPILGTGDGPILLAGGRLSVDRHLLLHSGAGPIRSAPGERMILEAGRSVQLSGGTLQLESLSVEAGAGEADDLVHLRSGPLVGGGLGRLELSDARLRATRLHLEGAGGLALTRVEARARGGLVASGADVQLETSTLRGTDVVLQSRGNLAASQLRAEAATTADGGHLTLEAGGSREEAPALRLEGTQLTGRTIQVTASGSIAFEGVHARTGTDGAAGEIGISARSQANAPAASLSLRDVNLQAEDVTLSAAGDLQAHRLRAQAQRHWLRAGTGDADGGAHLTLNSTVLSGLASGPSAEPAQLIKAEASGDLRGADLHMGGRSVLLRASGTLSLMGNTQLSAPGAPGLIRLEARASKDGAQKGVLSLQDTHLQAETILAQAADALVLNRANLQAGSPGQWGLVRLETAPSEERTDGVGPGVSGEAQISGSSLAGQWLLLRSGGIAMQHSRLEAPKGMIHLEAKAGDLSLVHSSLDVGVHSLEDLQTELNQREQVYGLLIDSTPLPPSIGLFAAENLDIRAGSQISASQIIRELRTQLPEPSKDRIRLNDTSGLVVATAGEGLTVREGSRIDVDASDSLAGVIALEAKASKGNGQLMIQNATLSASGGAGSGDIRLQSSNGIKIEAHSLLLASSHNKPEDRNVKGKTNWFGNTTFSGGEITLTNSSQLHAISIRDSRLLAEQSGSGELLSTLVLDGRGQGGRPKSFIDIFDSSDVGAASIGGIINLISAGGIATTGPETLISVDSRSANGQELQSLGGTIRIFNFADTPLQKEDGARFSLATSDTPTPESPSRIGNLVSYDPASIPLPDDLNWGLDRDPNPYLLQVGSEYSDQIVSGGESFGDHPHGLPGIIKDRVNPGIPDMVILEGAPPRALTALPTPASVPVAAKEEERAIDEAAQRFTEAMWQPMAPMNVEGSPLITPLSLNLGAQDPAALAAPMVDVRQEMAEAAARDSFQASEQEAMREVSTALGLKASQKSKLEIANLQWQLRRAFPEETSIQKMQTQPIAVPAILQISSESLPTGDRLQINHIIIPAAGEIRGWQTTVPAAAWKQTVKSLQQSLSQQARLDGAAQRLSSVLLDPVLPELRRLGVTTLLLSLDRGLQGVPFAALPANGNPLIEQLAITVTPSLMLTDLQARTQGRQNAKTILAGASHFTNGLMPLPMVQEELQQVASLHPGATLLIDSSFNSQSLLRQIQHQPVSILHLATHAEFSQSPNERAVIYTSTGQIPLQELGGALRTNNETPLSLLVLNACRTAVGDEDQELGIAGLALQAGASSALGNLWLVDDVVSAAFSVQFHRAIQQGLPSDQALRQTQQQFLTGQIKVQHDRIINGKGDVLIKGLSRADQARLRPNLQHPYYWAGAILSGKPW